MFLSNEPLILSSQSQGNEITLNLPDAGNEQFYISVFPKWLALETMNGKMDNGVLTLKYSIKKPETGELADQLTGKLVISVGNIGLFQTDVIYGNIGSTPDQTLQNVKLIEGKVIDAAYHKLTDKLVIATQNPNRLIVIQGNSGTSTTINLDKSPACMEISSDGKSLILGYTIAEIDLFNLENNILQRGYQIDCIPFDLVLGQNGYCYISPSDRYDYNLRSLNLTTGLWNSGKTPPFSYTLYGQSLLKKIGGKPLLAATRTGVSPAGLLLIDISHDIPNDTIAYWHDNTSTIWPFTDGSRFFAEEGQCYFMPAYIANMSIQPGLKSYGKLKLNQLRINSIDQCEAKNSFFVAERNVAELYYNQNRDNMIEQFDATNLNLIQTFKPSLTAVKKEDKTVLLNNEIWYTFANSTGTKLFAIRAITPEIDVKQWSVETFDIK
jgi:WD40 repeat protein